MKSTVQALIYINNHFFSFLTNLGVTDSLIKKRDIFDFAVNHLYAYQNIEEI